MELLHRTWEPRDLQKRYWDRISRKSHWKNRTVVVYVSVSYEVRIQTEYDALGCGQAKKSETGGARAPNYAWSTNAHIKDHASYT